MQTSNPGRQVDFPILERYNREALDTKLRYVSDSVREEIEAVQPYRVDTHGVEEPRQHLLWLLHSLDNVDKHRRLTVTTPGYALEFQVGDHTSTFAHPGGRVEDGMEVPFSWDVDPELEALGVEMRFQPAFVLEVDEPEYTTRAEIHPAGDLTQIYTLLENEIFPIFGE